METLNLLEEVLGAKFKFEKLSKQFGCYDGSKFGFLWKSHRTQIRLIFDLIHENALQPLGPFGALVLWCFVLNPHQPHAHLTSSWRWELITDY